MTILPVNTNLSHFFRVGLLDRGRERRKLRRTIQMTSFTFPRRRAVLRVIWSEKIENHLQIAKVTRLRHEENL